MGTSEPGNGADFAAEFPSDLSTPGAARRFLRSSMEARRIPELPLETAILLGSELVSNAVLHARTDIGVRLLVHDECIRVEVHDGNSRRPSHVAIPDDATSGRGLHLVQHLADNWGVEGTSSGKVVWFEVPLDGAGDGV